MSADLTFFILWKIEGKKFGRGVSKENKIARGLKKIKLFFL